MVAASEIEANNYESSEVQKFFEESRIFITGGSGFLGQLLVQKLIRNCPDITKMYLLIRAKKGKTPEQRFEEMFQDPVFERMKFEQPNYKEKIKLLIGDIEQPDLGLSDEDRKLITDQVNIIFHLAATVNFEEKIKKATAIHVRATKDLIKLSKTISNLKVFVHVSTAFTHNHEPDSVIKEQFYDVPITPDRLMEITEVLNNEELDILTPKLISGWPYTYTFTKAIAERLIQECGKDLPIAVVKPSMVISTVNDPVEGWINNVYGPVGMSVASAIGLLHSFHLPPDGDADMVPADYVVNSIIVAGHHVGNSFSNNTKKDPKSNIIFDELMRSKETTIFNYTSYSENKITWQKFHDYISQGLNYQTVHTIWYHFFMFVPNYYMSRFYHILWHLTPAYIVDFISVVLGKKPRMVKIYKKIDHFQNLIRNVAGKTWAFENVKTQMLWKNLNSVDRRLFPFSMKELDWNNYFDGYCRGGRIYLLKDPMDTLPKALARYQKLKIAHYCLVTILSLGFLTVIYKILQMFF